MGARRKARTCALQILYAVDVTGLPEEEARTAFWTGCRVDPRVREFAEAIVAGTLGERARIDALIRTHAVNWDVERMASLDRNILRAATWELSSMPETPSSVVINEAIELAKQYSTDESGKFVNGVLDHIRAAVRPLSPTGGEPESHDRPRAHKTGG